MPRTRFLLVALVLSVGGCRPDSSASERRGAPERASRDAVAEVNGVAITAEDLRLARAGCGHGGGDATACEAAMLDGLIAEELAAQRAGELGLSPPAASSAAEGPAGRAHRRKTLAEAFHRSVVAGAQVSEAEARAWFASHADRIGTEVRVRYILMREPDEATQVAAEIASGAALVEVARRRARKPPAGAGTPPWEMGWLRWNQVPAPWRDVVYDLAPGTPSQVIEGPNRRYWIIEVVARREAPGRTFDGERALILDELTAQRQIELRIQADAELRRRATVVVGRTEGER